MTLFIHLENQLLKQCVISSTSTTLSINSVEMWHCFLFLILSKKLSSFDSAHDDNFFCVSCKQTINHLYKFNYTTFRTPGICNPVLMSLRIYNPEKTISPMISITCLNHLSFKFIYCGCSQMIVDRNTCLILQFFWIIIIHSLQSRKYSRDWKSPSQFYPWLASRQPRN